MDEPRTQRFLIVENEAKYAAWIQHAIGAGWPNDSIVIMDWASFAPMKIGNTRASSFTLRNKMKPTLVTEMLSRRASSISGASRKLSSEDSGIGKFNRTIQQF